jgi:enoyl-CoA hydratase/carnithine racemase
MLVMGRTMSAEDARQAGFVNMVVPTGHALNEAKKAARDICALPPDAVASARGLLKLPAEDLLRRIAQEEHVFTERMRSTAAVAAFENFLSRSKI